jgi:HSP20 family protein
MFDLIRNSSRTPDLFALPDIVSRFLELDGGLHRTGLPLLPPIDVLETDTEIRLMVECAGLDRESLSVTYEGSTLTVSGEKKSPWEGSQDARYNRERRFGKFSRSFTVPLRVDSTKISATYSDGILEIVLPKAQEAQPQRIQIQTR